MLNVKRNLVYLVGRVRFPVGELHTREERCQLVGGQRVDGVRHLRVRQVSPVTLCVELDHRRPGYDKSTPSEYVCHIHFICVIGWPSSL